MYYKVRFPIFWKYTLNLKHFSNKYRGLNKRIKGDLAEIVPWSRSFAYLNLKCDHGRNCFVKLFLTFRPSFNLFKLQKCLPLALIKINRQCALCWKAAGELRTRCMSDELTGRRISSVENVFYFISALIDVASNDFTRTGGRNNKGKTNKERIKKNKLEKRWGNKKPAARIMRIRCVPFCASVCTRRWQAFRFTVFSFQNPVASPVCPATSVRAASRVSAQLGLLKS